MMQIASTSGSRVERPERSWHMAPGPRMWHLHIKSGCKLGWDGLHYISQPYLGHSFLLQVRKCAAETFLLAKTSLAMMTTCVTWNRMSEMFIKRCAEPLQMTRTSSGLAELPARSISREISSAHSPGVLWGFGSIADEARCRFSLTCFSKADSPHIGMPHRVLVKALLHAQSTTFERIVPPMSGGSPRLSVGRF